MSCWTPRVDWIRTVERGMVETVFEGRNLPQRAFGQMNKIQLSVMEGILASVGENIDPDITTTIDNSRAPAVDSPIAVDDVAAGVFATFGGLAATLRKMQGLPSPLA